MKPIVTHVCAGCGLESHHGYTDEYCAYCIHHQRTGRGKRMDNKDQNRAAFLAPRIEAHAERIQSDLARMGMVK